MDHFVRIITTKQEGISSINESVFPDQYLYESEDECVLELPLPRALSEEESDVFAEKLSNLLFAEGYENFDLEFSTDELEEGDGTIRKGLGAMAILAALGMAIPSAEDTPLGKAMQAAADAGDPVAAEHLDQLDFYSEENPAMIVKLSNMYLNKNESIEEITLEGDEFFESYGWLEHSLEEAEYQGRKVKLNNPVRSTDGPKKFHVYVKDGDRVKKVNFGDPNMEIKRDNPERRKSFRARHNCDNSGPKTKARYWSCKKW